MSNSAFDTVFIAKNDKDMPGTVHATERRPVLMEKMPGVSFASINLRR